MRSLGRFVAAAALAAALSPAGSASAQDQIPTPLPERIPAASAASSPRLDLTIACQERDGLSLCVRPKAVHRLKAAPQAEGRAYGAFNKLTRLAGMFMGRVDAAEIGDFRLRVTLDLR